MAGLGKGIAGIVQQPGNSLGRRVLSPNSPFAERLQIQLEAEKAQEEQMLQQRMMQEAQFRATLPQSSPQPQGPSIADYIRGMRGQEPQAPMPQQQKKPSWLDYFPSRGSVMQAIGMGPGPNQALDQRLAHITGDMGMNNARIRQRLDDMERERIRQAMVPR